MAQTFKKMKAYVTGEEEEEKGIMDQVKDEVGSISYRKLCFERVSLRMLVIDVFR